MIDRARNMEGFEENAGVAAGGKDGAWGIEEARGHFRNADLHGKVFDHLTHPKNRNQFFKKKRRRRPPNQAQRSQVDQSNWNADLNEIRGHAAGGKEGNETAKRWFDSADNHRQEGKKARRKFAATGESLVAVSDNKGDDLSFEQALQRARSGDQKVFKKSIDQFIEQHGLKAQTQTAVGDWEDGAEHSVLATLDGTADAETVKYLAAWSGLLGNQRAVLSFVPAAGGLDSVYTVQVPETNLGLVRKSLSKHGIAFRTIVPGPKGSRVVIYDEKRAVRDKVAAWAGAFGATVRESIGSGEYVGGGSRTAARAKYRDIIARFESARKPAAPAGGGVQAG